MSNAILQAEKTKARKKAYRASPEGKAAADAYNKKYALENAERLHAYRIEKYAATKDERCEAKALIDKEYRDRNKAVINAKRRIKLQEDIGQRERAIERSQQWYKDNKDAVIEKARLYYLKNQEQIRANIYAYQKANPEATRLLHRVKAHRRRERLAEAGGEFTRQDIEKLMLLQRGQCVNCHKPLKDSYHIDHKIPVAKGGSNHPHDLELLCPPCNSRKSDKLPHVFAQENGRLL